MGLDCGNSRWAFPLGIHGGHLRSVFTVGIHSGHLLQSAYRKFHSTETALLKLTNDIMESIDSGKITILTALDMSAAFDTLDHITLLHRLQHTFGLSGYAISWIRSYLTDRSSFVKIDSSSSPSTKAFHHHTHRRASGLCSWTTAFRSFHITNRKCHKS